MGKKYYGSDTVYDNDIIVAAGDVETDGLGGELLMIQYGIFGSVETLTGERMVERFFDAIKDYTRPVIWYFHFGQYDWRYFLSYFQENKVKVEIAMRSESDIYELRIYFDNKTPVVLRDSYAIWPHSLADLSKNFCPELPKLDIDIEHFDINNPEHIKYARRDVEILLHGLPKMFDYLGELFNVTPGPTVAGTAVRAWQKTLAENEIYDGSEWGEEEAYIRQAYYGGLVFMTTNKPVMNCETFDLNSSYPASMRDYGVPVGRRNMVTDFVPEKMGIYRCRVKAPDNVIVPILPGRNGKGAMRWYAGEFDTQITSSELVFAAKNGYEILEIYDGIVFEDIAYPFDVFINKCKFIREKYKHEAREFLAKLMQNSIYGRFGSRRMRSSMFSAHEAGDELLGATPYDEYGHWYVKQEFDEDMLCLPEWAVFITAHSRLRLLSSVYAIGPENCIYGDTDSITVKSGYSHLLDIGNDYGQWKLEKRWSVFRAVAPKVYSGILVDGDFKGAAKGLPKKSMTDTHWRELLDDGATATQTLSLDSLRVAFKKGVRPAELRLRKSTDITKSKNYNLLSDGTVVLKSRDE